MALAYASHPPLVATEAPTSLGGTIRAHRNSLGWTQAQFAEYIGMSVIMLKSIEAGTRKPSTKALQRIATVLGTTLDALLGGRGGDQGGQGGGDDGMAPDDYETFLRAAWSLYYANRVADAVPSVLSGIKALMRRPPETRWLRTLGRFHQLAGVLARETNAINDAMRHGAVSVDLARQIATPDDLATALFRYARTMLAQGNKDRGLGLIREAHALAPRCRNPLRGSLAVLRVDIESKTGASGRLQLQQFLDRAYSEANNRPGIDDSFTQLNRPGIQHIDALVLIRDQAPLPDVLGRLRAAMRDLDPDLHRWRANMEATEALAYAQAGDVQSAVDIATGLIERGVPTAQLGKYLNATYESLRSQERTRNDPNTRKLGSLLGSTA